MISLDTLRQIQQHSTQLRVLLASPRPRIVSPARTEPLDLTPTYRERSPFRPIPTARPLTIPRFRAKRETSRSRTEASLNARVTEPLSRLYGSRASEILSQASDEFHYRTRAEASAEPYELYESGLIDSAIENLRLRRWTVGRPKTD